MPIQLLIGVQLEIRRLVNRMTDNLVQIGHNVSIGKNCIIAMMTGISGSTKIGNNVLIGGQVGISGHLNIGNNVKIAAKSGNMKTSKITKR